MYVTRDFGREVLASNVDVPLEGPRTALSLLRAHHDVVMEDVPAVVKAIDGLMYRSPVASPDEELEQLAVRRILVRQRRDMSESLWVSNLNGIETDPLPRDLELFPGDVLQWDLRDWDIGLPVRATVGAFPQPFTGGMFGERFPTSVRCSEPASRACETVEQALSAAGVRLSDPSRRASGVPDLQVDRAQVIVGRWADLRAGRWTSALGRHPEDSGVFARFSRDGKTLRTYDWAGKPAAAMGRGSGLVAAMRPTEPDLVWVVTGVDSLGVQRAASSLDPRALRNAFAVVLDGRGIEKVPVEPPRFDGGR